MEISGKIIQVMEVVTGSGKKGPWHKQEFIIDQGGQFPKKVALSIFGEDKINKYDLCVGLVIKVQFELESREYNGRWYSEVKAYRITWDNQQVRNWQPGGES